MGKNDIRGNKESIQSRKMSEIVSPVLVQAIQLWRDSFLFTFALTSFEQ